MTKRQQSTESKTILPLPVFGLAVLWFLVLASALGVVGVTQDSRQQINRLEQLRREASSLQVEWGRYLLEQSTWAAYSRVENLALSELNMRVPAVDQIVMVKP